MTEIEPCPRYGAGLLNDFGGGDVNWWQDYLRAELERAHDFYEAAWPAPTAPSGDVERAVMVCPQCEGEGGYPDGLDEAACHTECTRCGSNGWIVDRAAIAAMREHMLPSPDTPPVAKSESPVVSDTAAQLAEAQREIERKEWKP